MTRITLAIKYLLIGLVGMLLLPACQDSELEQRQVSPPPNQDPETEQIELLPPPAATVNLTRVDDDLILESYLKAGIRARTQLTNSDPVDDNIFFGVPPSITTFASTIDINESSVSHTNLQEAGVDEADRIKSDGQWLYLLNPPYCCTETAPPTSHHASCQYPVGERP